MPPLSSSRNSSGSSSVKSNLSVVNSNMMVASPVCTTNSTNVGTMVAPVASCNGHGWNNNNNSSPSTSSSPLNNYQQGEGVLLCKEETHSPEVASETVIMVRHIQLFMHCRVNTCLSDF